METQKNNELIASFMGLQESERLCKNSPTYVGDDIVKAGLPFIGGIMGNCMNDLPFNSSWDWLMPVVERIESIDFVVAIRTNTVSICNNSGNDLYFQNSVCETKIKSLYEAIIKFINWHNKTH